MSRIRWKSRQPPTCPRTSSSSRPNQALLALLAPLQVWIPLNSTLIWAMIPCHLNCPYGTPTRSNFSWTQGRPWIRPHICFKDPIWWTPMLRTWAHKPRTFKRGCRVAHGRWARALSWLSLQYSSSVLHTLFTSLRILCHVLPLRTIDCVVLVSMMLVRCVYSTRQFSLFFLWTWARKYCTTGSYSLARSPKDRMLKIWLVSEQLAVSKEDTGNTLFLNLQSAV